MQRGRSVVGRSIGRLLVGAVKSVARGMFYVGQLDVPTAFPLLYALKRTVSAAMTSPKLNLSQMDGDWSAQGQSHGQAVADGL